jgi:hypothetical protein
MKDLTTISSDLFNKIRSRFTNIKLGDENGALTSDPATARFFDVNFAVGNESLGRVNIKIDDEALTVIYDQKMVEGQAESVKSGWFDFLKELRMFAKKNLLTFDTRDITKSNLEKRDYQHLAHKTGEDNMSESKLFGTSKTSYQDMGEAKIIVKHSAPINYNNPAGRTQRIESIYIESAAGERFRYPHRHLNGARAMARHVANGGNVYDEIGTHISGLSEELSKLRQFKAYTQKSGVMAEALGDITQRVQDRIDSIKLEVSQLQKQSHYASFVEGFSPSATQDVPEDVMSGWVDALTIKTFNEELKSVFPYIYKLVSEKKDDEVRYEDLVAEGEACDVCHQDPCVCEEDEMQEAYVKSSEDAINTLGALRKIGKKIETGQDTYDGNLANMYVNDVYDVISWVENNLNTNDPKYKEVLEPVIELRKKAKGMEREMGSGKDARFGNEIVNTLYPFMQWIEMAAMDVKEDSMFAEFEKQINTLASLQYEMDDQEGNDEDEESDDTDMASDNDEEDNSSIKQEVLEFITSMYDSNTGTFPRGEEGVKIAVEKKFGEQAGRFAGFVVEKLSVKTQMAVEEPTVEDETHSELTRIRSLAGF